MQQFDTTGGYPQLIARPDGDALMLAVADALPHQVARACVCRLYERRHREPTEGDVVQEAASLLPPVTLSTATASRALRWLRRRARQNVFEK